MSFSENGIKFNRPSDYDQFFSCFQMATVDPTFVQKPGPGTSAMLREATDSKREMGGAAAATNWEWIKSDPGGHQIWFLLDVPLVFFGDLP